MDSKVKSAFKELVAAIGGEKNIILFGFKTNEELKQISIHLRRKDVIKYDAFVFFEGVHCLEQSQGISIIYENSSEMEEFYKYLNKTQSEKNVNMKGLKLKRRVDVPGELKVDAKEKLVRRRKITRKESIDF